MTLIKSISGIRGTIGGKTRRGINTNGYRKYFKRFWRLVKEKWW